MPPTQNRASCDNGRIKVAAEWYRANRAQCPRPIIPFMILNFGLAGPREAVEALKLATLGGAISTPLSLFLEENANFSEQAISKYLPEDAPVAYRETLGPRRETPRGGTE